MGLFLLLYLQMALRAGGPVHDATAGTAAVAAQRELVFHSRWRTVVPEPVMPSLAAGDCGKPFVQPLDLNRDGTNTRYGYNSIERQCRIEV